MRCFDQYDKKFHHVTYQWYRWYQWYHWQQKSVQGFLVTIGKNGTNSTIGRFADSTVGRTPNVATVFWLPLVKMVPTVPLVDLQILPLGEPRT